jgi:hypothetical protein
MTYDLALTMGWLPRDVRALTVTDLVGLTRAADRRDRRAKGRKR